MLPNCLTFFNAKGGTGKTTTTAHHAVACAAQGWRVLVVDLDPQGNQASTLGYDRDPRWDGGVSLHDAVATKGRSKPQLLLDVRPGLDVIGGGPEAAAVAAHLQMHAGSDPTYALNAIEMMLAPYAGDYDLILLDLPPSTGGPLHDAALNAAHYVVVTVAANKLSKDGLSAALRMVKARQQTQNPDLEVLGLSVQNWDIKATKSVRKFIKGIQDVVGDKLEFIEPVVRASDSADAMQKDLGLVSIELAGKAKQDKQAVLAWLRTKEGERPDVVPDTMRALAKDYAKLTAEVNRRYTEALAQWGSRRAEAAS